jgi:hypothetical protein
MPAQEKYIKFITLLKRVSEKSPRNGSFWSAFEKLDELDVEQISILSAAAPRRLGRSQPVLTEEEQNYLSDLHGSLLTANIGFLGRFLLVLCIKDADSLKEIITRGGDDEQAAAIMALNLRDDREVYVDNVVHACRTNSPIVFSAAAHDNPYAAKYFNDQEFKQLTIKTIFMGLDFDRIDGLEGRFNGDLGKSLTDFFEERQAAGRWLPDSVLEFMKRKGLLE